MANEHQSPAATAHALATRAAHILVAEGAALNLTWEDILVACETTMTIVVMARTKRRRPDFPDPVRYATTLVEVMAEAVTERVTQAINKERPDAD